MAEAAAAAAFAAAAAAAAEAVVARPRRAPPPKIGAVCPSLEPRRTFSDVSDVWGVSTFQTFLDVFERFRALCSEIF